MKKGFTLVELLVVVAILGILEAVGVVSYNGFIGSARENVVKENFKNVSRSLTLACHRAILICHTIARDLN